ncbi:MULTISPECIES: B12-binding domain-containing protein [Corallococcus]|uniref:cobalamin B12-binding domain-containing protein n=1 Tax=Corallococcus TaxID=83461 RepID=UPI00117F9267|nr:MULTISPECIES: cobalamin-dependent protein [Corallococcus]NBD09723.1 cobalamin-binding protein [Corallococcus silvisoli]TSC24042.1 cobalamin-binding protein [Corallococcus sp. Z5C101001]
MHPSPSVIESLRTRYLTAQLSGNRQEALRLLVDEGLLCGVPLQDLHLSIIQAAQYEIGRLWQENHISVAQEHMATAISQFVLAHLYRHLPRDPSNGKVVMMACVEGELHEVGARMASDFLEMAGFDVRFIGANVPADHLARMVREAPPDLLALSVTMPFHLPQVRESVRKVREVAPALPIAVGGLAFDWTPVIEEELKVSFFGKSARELVASTCRTLGV